MEHRTVSGELGKIGVAVRRAYSVLRPFHLSIGFAFLMYGLGASLRGQIEGPGAMGVGGALVGLALPYTGRPR
jgi:hypothetical protein